MEVILGFVLFVFNCIYLVYFYDSILESYICLFGVVLENYQGVYVFGLMIFNLLEYVYCIIVFKIELVLFVYVWIGLRDKFVGQKMVFSCKWG